MQAIDLYKTDTVKSKDGTSIGYRQYGNGPGVVLLQGAMGFAANYSELAEVLSGAFTVYVPDRRGRGMSPFPYPKDYTIQRDVEDLEALLIKTAAHNVFALSSGAVISLTAASSSSLIRKLAIFEPPLFACGPLPITEMARFEKAISQDNIAAALTAAGKAVNMFPLLKYIPSWLLTLLMTRTLVNEGKKPAGNDPTLREITQTLRFDFRIIAEIHGEMRGWSGIHSEMLLLGGGKSPEYLKKDLDALQGVLPLARRVTFPECGHSAAWNYDKKRNPSGDPAAVAKELRNFFSLLP